jgi:hypothetical protein
MLKRIESELERIGLLLEHDAGLPSITTLVAGAPIRSSWWGHPLGHRIYDLINELASGSGKLSGKIVNGKVTYVHPRLWDAFLVVVQDKDPKRVHGLSQLALALWGEVERRGVVRGDALRDSRFAPAPALKPAFRELELRLLVHTEGVHTESGAHAKVLRAWSAWAADHHPGAERPEPAAARAALARAVATLGENSGREPQVPW